MMIIIIHINKDNNNDINKHDNNNDNIDNKDAIKIPTMQTKHKRNLILLFCCIIIIMINIIDHDDDTCVNLRCNGTSNSLSKNNNTLCNIMTILAIVAVIMMENIVNTNNRLMKPKIFNTFKNDNDNKDNHSKDNINENGNKQQG